MLSPDTNQITLNNTAFKRYLGWVIATLAAIFLALYAHEWWQNRHMQSYEAAAQLFTQTFDETQPGIKAGPELAHLYQSHDATIYATLAKMYEAQYASQHHHWHKASIAWKWILQNNKIKEIQVLARLELAHLALLDHQPGQALVDLSSPDLEHAAWRGSQAYIMGLAHESMGQDALAQSDFRRAYTLLNDQHQLNEDTAKLLWMHIQNSSPV